MVNTDRLARAFELQGNACEHFGSPLYGALMRAVADDVRAGGPMRAVLAGHEEDPGPSALALRLFGPVHRIVLEGRAPELATYFPSAGGRRDGGDAWPAFRRTVEEHLAELRRDLHQVPQTNEPGRAACLVGGLLLALARLDAPVRLFEIGASAGVNLRADRACIWSDDTIVWGDPASPFQLRDAWKGTLPPSDRAIEVIERRGCDLAPIDPASEDGQRRLLSYVWPDMTDRFARLQGALAVAARVPATVERAGAADFLTGIAPMDGALTVLWHSIMWQYLSETERDRCSKLIEEIGAAATSAAPVAHIALEPRRLDEGKPHRFLVTVTQWPGGEDVLAGEAHPHGIPVEWWER